MHVASGFSVGSGLSAGPDCPSSVPLVPTACMSPHLACATVGHGLECSACSHPLSVLLLCLGLGNSAQQGPQDPCYSSEPWWWVQAGPGEKPPVAGSGRDGGTLTRGLRSQCSSQSHLPCLGCHRWGPKPGLSKCRFPLLSSWSLLRSPRLGLTEVSPGRKSHGLSSGSLDRRNKETSRPWEGTGDRALNWARARARKGRRWTPGF